MRSRSYMKVDEFMGNVIQKTKRRIWRTVGIMLGREPRIVCDVSLGTEYHGTDAGGWAVLKNSLSASSVVVSVGVGEDASFDLSLMGKYGLNVHAFDPTPKAVVWAQVNINDSRFHLYPEALSDNDGSIRLYLPEDDNHVSASIAKKSTAFFDAPCVSILTIFKRLNVDVIDVFKMDIEGAEYLVLDSIVNSNKLKSIKQLLVEFHHFMPGFTVRQTSDSISVLNANGFDIAWASYTGHEVLFVNRRFL